ncbi:hypothetical protein [Chryseobacterium sp.]|uniref:hypothetical protein n=1 Tax=Chryseobacterium sp. TaxID=1871047 RepID=UPI0028977F48|nr:hypothetical protein [Chryseobacterium sp.]
MKKESEKGWDNKNENTVNSPFHTMLQLFFATNSQITIIPEFMAIKIAQLVLAFVYRI